MFNFKALVATAAIAATSIFAPAAVEARTHCNTVAGFDVCYIDNGNYGTDKIGVFLPNGQNVAFMSVICTGGGGNRWEADRNRQYISYGDLEALANRWCRNY